MEIPKEIVIGEGNGNGVARSINIGAFNEMCQSIIK